MEAISSAMASMKFSFSLRSQDGQDEKSSSPRTPVTVRSSREELPSAYSPTSAKFDEESPSSPEVPGLADASSSGSSSHNNDCMFSPGDLIRSLQACGTSNALTPEDISFDVLWTDFEEDPKEEPHDEVSKTSEVASVGLLAYTTARSSDYDESDRPAPCMDSHDTKGRLTRYPPAPSVKKGSAYSCCKSWRYWAYAIVVLLVIVALVAVLVTVLDSSRGESNNSSGDETNLEPWSSPTSPSPVTATLEPSPLTTLAPSQRVTPTPTASPTVHVIKLPAVPETRFTPFSQLPESTVEMISNNLLGYDRKTWNLLGSANNNRNGTDVFWEGLSWETIQNVSPRAVSIIAQLGFWAQQWDCWINHYQDYTWEGLYQQSAIEIIFVEDEDVVIRGRNLQAAMTSLGWTDNNWDTSERFDYFFPLGTDRGDRPPWDELTLAEQEAATTICWTRELWDRIPLFEWVSV